MVGGVTARRVATGTGVAGAGAWATALVRGTATGAGVAGVGGVAANTADGLA